MSKFFLIAALVCVCWGYNVPLSEQDKQDLLSHHNLLRSNIANGKKLAQSTSDNQQPPAANMRQMEWSAGIEAKTKEYAAQGKYAHSSQAFRTYNDGEVDGYHGENLAYAWTSSNNYGWKVAKATAPVDGWIMEEEKFYHYEEGKQGKCFGTPVGNEQVQCGHYTQGVWATSYLLGCASTYKKDNGVEDKNSVIVICQYNGGNLMSNGVFDVYKKGTACSKCPSGWTKCNSGLCARSAGGFTAPAPTSPPTTPPPTTATTSTTSGGSGSTSVSTSTKLETQADGTIKKTVTTVTKTTYSNGSTSTSTSMKISFVSASTSTSSGSSAEKGYGYDAGNNVDLTGSDDDDKAENVEIITKTAPALEPLLVNMDSQNCVDTEGKPCNPNRRRLMFGGKKSICTCK